MRLINTKDHYGLISILLHWSVALLTIGLFVLGLWMVDLGYYDDWYYQAPWWHKGLGFIVFLLVVFRWLWRPLAGKPAAISSTPVWQQWAAKAAHQLMNIAIVLLAITGYLIVTAKGEPLGIFDWFNKFCNPRRKFTVLVLYDRKPTCSVSFRNFGEGINLFSRK